MHLFGNTLIYANPTASLGKGAGVAAQVNKLLRSRGVCATFDSSSVASAGSYQELAHSLGAYDTAARIGGDGTLNAVVNALMCHPRFQRPTFGLVLCGLGNDYARTLNMPANPVRADQLLHHKVVHDYTLEMREEESEHGQMYLFAVQVGPTYGSGFAISPQARIDDALLDL